MTDTVRTLLHGMRRNDWPLPELRRMRQRRGAPRNTLNLLHNSLLQLPCSICFSKTDAVRDIIPYQYRVHHLCSDHCRNAIDRAQRKHGAEFAAAATLDLPYNVFKEWKFAIDQVENICLSSTPGAVVLEKTPLCAPGYATLKHPEFLFTQSDPAKSTIVSAFSHGTDGLIIDLPRWTPIIGKDEESQSTLFRRMSESVCNKCASELLVGHDPMSKRRVNEFYNDKYIDPEFFTKAAKKYVVTCLRMTGDDLTAKQQRELWEMMGLDRYD